MGSALGAAGLWAVAGAPAAAQVSGGTVAAGSAQISGAGTANVIVTQSSAKAVIDWRSFSVDAGGSVRFAQPDRAAVTLNRVTGGTTSRIDGSLTANGQVWLLNPNGVIVGNGGRIAAGGFLATTHALSNDDFLAGRYGFTDAAAAGAAVVNAGRIAADEGGYAVLAGRQAANLGLIEARLGTVALGAARQFTLDLAGDRLLSFAVAGELDAAAVVNRGALRADGGRVLMTARAAADVVDGVVNNQGLVQATSVKLVDGQIVLDGGDRGTVLAGGRLDASGLRTGETGGTVAVLGDTVIVGDGATLDARGASGGGEIYVGGGWQGETVLGHKSAVRVAVAPTATLDASAVASGNGGTVAAWSDVANAASRTYALGTFRADGGAVGGDGGRIETSGHDLITTGVRGSAAAPHGKAGTWLFDPYDIEIVTGNAAELDNPGFEDGLTGWTRIGSGGSVAAVDVAFNIFDDQFKAQDGQRFLNAFAGSTGSKVGVEQTFDAQAGQTISVFGLFLGDDYLPFNDKGLIELSGPNGFYKVLYSRDISQVGNFGVAPWEQTPVFALPSSGSYTIRASVSNTQDAVEPSQIGFEVATSGFGGRFGASSTGQLWTATRPGSKVYVEKINTLLSAGTNVHISTAGAGTDHGDITVNAAIVKTGEAAAALKLEADRSIIVNQGITSTGGRLDVELLAKTGTIDLNRAIDVWPNATSAGKVKLDAVAIDIASQGSLRGGDIELIANSFHTPGNPDVKAMTSVAIAPRTLSRAIKLGQNSSQGDVLSLGAILKDLEAPTLVIGHAQGTGTIEVMSSFSDQSLAASTQNLVVRTPGTGGRIEIKSNIDIPEGAAWRFVAGDEIVLNNSRFGVDGLLELVAGQRFTNQSGRNALETGDSGRWLIYSADPSLSTFDGLTSGATALWGQDFADAAAGTIETTGNRYAFGLTPTLTVSGGSRSKTYGETLTFGPGDFTVTGLIDAAQYGNVFAQDQFIGTPVLASAGAAERANAGTYSIEIEPGSFEAPENYGVTFELGSLTVDPKALSLSLTGTVRKTYDGTTDATLTAANYAVGADGVLVGDEVAIATTAASYIDKNAGTGKLVTVQSVELTGASAGNYRVVGPVSGEVGQIDQKAISGTATVGNKIYDGTTVAVGAIELADIVAGDEVTVGGASYRFVDKNVGTGKTVNITNVFLSGADAGNYALTVGPAVANIAKKAITATATANDKIYDRTTSATGSIDPDEISGDDVTAVGAQFVFSDKNAGVAKRVDISGAQLSGADAGNYDFIAPTVTTATISPKAITASVAAQNKIYDGTTAAAGSVTLNGTAEDLVSATGTVFAFTDKNAGTGKMVIVTGTTLTGDEAGNYVLSTPATTMADILKKVLAVHPTAATKVYDGTTAATGELTPIDFVPGDKVSVNGAQFAFVDKNAGTGKTVNVTGAKLTGADADNYSLSVGSATAHITRKAITASATANDKVYDGTAAATGSIDLDGEVGGDDVTAVGAQFMFSDRNAGLGKVVAIDGVTLSGVDADNYMLTVPASTTADILKRAITANVAAQNKTYDGTTAAAGNVTLNGVLTGDLVATTGTQFAFTDRNAGTGKTVNITGTTLSGADAGNYALSTPATTMADILKKVLAANASASAKTYDGTVAATGQLTLSGVVGGDKVSVNGTQFAFTDKNAGTGKTVNISGARLTGADADNYSLTAPATTVADILRKQAGVQASAANKIYDGTTAATGMVSLTGLVTGDLVATQGAQFAFADPNVGTGKAVSLTGLGLAGADAGNYVLGPLPTLTANVAPKALTASLTGSMTKIYDATTAATLSAANYSLAGFVAGQGATVGQTNGSFASPGVGSNLVVTAALGGASFTANSGTSLSNYLLPTSASGAIGTITPATLTYVATTVSRPRGNPNPALGGSVTGFVGGETQSAATSGMLSFATPAAIDSPIGTYAIEGGGLSAANYVFVQAPGNATAFRVNEAMSTASTVANTVQTVAPPPTPAPPPAPEPAPTPLAPQAATAAANAANATANVPVGGTGGPAPTLVVAPPPPPPPPPPPVVAPQITTTGTKGSAAAEGPPPPPPSGPPVEATPSSPVGEAPPPTPSDGADGSDVVLAGADTPEEEQDEPTGDKRQVTSTTVVIPGVNVELPTPPRPVEVPGAELPFSGSANPAQW